MCDLGLKLFLTHQPTDGTLSVKVSKSPTTAMPFSVELDQNIQKSLEAYTDSYTVNNNDQ